MNVEIRAKRILKPMERFRLIDNPLQEGDAKLFMEGEACIGVYENNSGNDCDKIFVSNIGLIICSSGVEKHVLFEDIADTRSPSDKQDDCVLWLILRDGTEFPLEIMGRRGRFRDVFEFMRFLDRVVNDTH